MERQKVRRIALGRQMLVALAVCAVVAGSSYSVAGAVYSYHGADYSYDYNSKRAMKTCDKESDGNKTKTNWNHTNGSGSVTDHDGNNGICATASAPATISQHRTCEVGVLGAWNCDNWQAT